jgi:DNA polymerase I - 3''-5'' exonuclease and polymerase domains
LYGTYVKGLAKRVTAEGKVYTTYTLHGTTSGRLASRQPNLQNIVREKRIRNQFVVAHEDNRFIQLDYKQAEGRVITTLARDEYLREIFADPERDLFSELCNDIFGIDMWEKEQRVAMKSIFYGNAYGRGVKSIAKELQMQGSSITEAETGTLMREFNALIPDVMAWQSAVKQQVLAGNDLTTPFGRKRSFWLITDKNRSDVLNEALSYMPQSIASDICLRALIRLTPMLRDLATPRLTIHDAIVVETHKDNVQEVIALMQHEMVKSATEFTTYVPFEVDASVGTKWGDL